MPSLPFVELYFQRTIGGLKNNTPNSSNKDNSFTPVLFATLNLYSTQILMAMKQLYPETW